MAENTPVTGALVYVGRRIQGNRFHSSVENRNSHRKFSTSMNPRNNSPRFCPSNGDRVIQNRRYAGRTIPRQASQGMQGFRDACFFSGRNINPTSVHNGCSGSVSPSIGHFEYQDFRKHQHIRPSSVTGDSFGESDSPHSPGGAIAGGTRGGGAALHLVSRDKRLCSAVPSNINVVSVPLASTMEGRGDSTATSTTSAAIQDFANNEGVSLCGFRSHQYQSRRNGPTRGSIHAVRRIPDPSVVVPSTALVSISEETTTEDVDVYEEPENVVDIPIVVPSAELVSISEETITEDADVCEESENVDIPVAVYSVELVSVSTETSMDVDVREKSEIEVDISFVADFESLQTNPRKDDVPSEPFESLTDTEPGVGMPSPEVGLEYHAIQVRVGSESSTNVGGLKGKAHDDTELSGVKESVCRWCDRFVCWEKGC